MSLWYLTSDRPQSYASTVQIKIRPRSFTRSSGTCAVMLAARRHRTCRRHHLVLGDSDHSDRDALRTAIRGYELKQSRRRSLVSLEHIRLSCQSCARTTFISFGVTLTIEIVERIHVWSKTTFDFGVEYAFQNLEMADCVNSASS